MAIVKMSHRDKTPKPARHPEAPPAASKAHHQCPEPGNTSNPDAGLGHDPREVVLVRRRMREHKTRDVSHSSTGHAIEGPVRSHASSSTATQIAQNSLFERFSRAGYPPRPPAPPPPPPAGDSSKQPSVDRPTRNPKAHQQKS